MRKKMSEVTLREFVEHCARSASKVFELRGEVLPMYHCVRRSGEEMVLPAPSTRDKDILVAIMRGFFESHDVVRYVFIDEAWTVVAHKDDGEALRVAPSRHPDRREVLILIGEDEAEGQIMARRDISRPPGKRPRLGKLHLFDGKASEGRMVGLLLRPGTRH